MGEMRRVLLVLSDEPTLHLLERNILSPDNYQVLTARSCAEARKSVSSVQPDLMILGDNLADGDHLQLASEILGRVPTLPIVLFTSEENQKISRETLKLGLVDWLTPPLTADIVRDAVSRGMARSRGWEERLKKESSQYTRPLLERVDELESLSRIGRGMTSQLDLDMVLMTVMDAAVGLTGAEESSILLLDEDTGDLYMRAARNFQEDFVATFRLATDDTYAGQVMRTGKPVHLNADEAQKIKTSYLVHSLIYVPLTAHGRTIGVLGVDNRETGKNLSERHIALLSTMADYAVIAIENAKLFSDTELERTKLKNILTQIEDGVIVVDDEDELVLVNHTVRKAFNLGDKDILGKRLEAVFENRDLLTAIRGEALDPMRIEIKANDEHFYRVQVTDIPEIGRVASLHDISYLKELDRIKTDFVNTVSHDIRSPLTSILGYVELIHRAGEVNELQRDYINRVQTSVHNITSLISDLLDLGRIEEVGMLEDFELVPLSPILREAIEVIQGRAVEKKQDLKVNLPEKLPCVFGDKTQLRQMLNNLIGNAVKYTPDGGKISITGIEENGQIILQFSDTGWGVPLEEQAKIFDRFFRASNVPDGVGGTGLGLAITKSIVENHRGRIWVDSSTEIGSVFTVVLPASKDQKG